jgi:hypothetical protein
MRFRPISTAPKDGTHMLLLTGNGDVVSGWWDASVKNFYKSNPAFAVYDPDDHMGDWVCNWHTGDNDNRLFCGCTPTHWAPIGKLPKRREF